MNTASFHVWLSKLGYTAEQAGLHVRGRRVREGHPYALEIETLLCPEGTIRAQAVFDVEGVPTVVFLADESGEQLSTANLDRIRQRIWNQNLATVIIECGAKSARVVPTRKLPDARVIELKDAQLDGPFSALDVASANLVRRHPTWFDVGARVDRKLLENLSSTVKALSQSGFGRSPDVQLNRHRAELLMGQILFVSYLEHRRIVGETYRAKRNTQPLHQLIAHNDRGGIRDLIDCLCNDFNGDFLGDDRHDPWASLGDTGFQLLDLFLRRTDMETGQGDFWNYDFSFIPVELLSGLYESFLSVEEQAQHGAYYTPRHLAVMAVDQAFTASQDPLTETIFDGACGSGILLTTAYRRLIGLLEARENRQLSFYERRSLLVRQIFGADIHLMACRVTAFSLYLSLLEGLAPADIMEAQEKENVKLPNLAGSNLHHGPRADIFARNHAFAEKRFSLIISNPPWTEQAGGTITSADDWSLEAEVPFVRRQVAGAYSIRVLDFLEEDGRVCLILPIPLFLAPTSNSFVAYFLSRVRPRRLINFGDLQNLLFPTAENTCHLFVGVLRPSAEKQSIPLGEIFDYCVPKADLSLSYGRLTMQSADRHYVQTQSVVQESSLLVTLMWGDANDLTIWTRLASLGTFEEFWTGPKNARRWICRKGIHFEDASREAIDAGRLRRMPFVPIAALSAGSPALHSDLLIKWPADRKTVVGLTDEVLSVFNGPRVLFPDGFSREDLSVRAVYFDRPASFNHSIGVMAGPKNDAGLLQFAAIYLRSSLARYFLMMRGWKMLSERNGVHLSDVKTFPFFDPKHAPNPNAAYSALSEVQKRMDQLARLPEWKQADKYQAMKEELDNEVFKYFDLSSDERALVIETVEVLMPSIRPRSFKSLDTPIQRPAKLPDLKRYGKSLANSLTMWRKRTGGTGRFDVRVLVNDPRHAGTVGVVEVKYQKSPTAPATSAAKVDDQLVHSALSKLAENGFSFLSSGDGLHLIPDVHVWYEGSLFIARPLNKKSWTIRQALRDSEYLVRQIQRHQRPQALTGVS